MISDPKTQLKKRKNRCCRLNAGQWFSASCPSFGRSISGEIYGHSPQAFSWESDWGKAVMRFKGAAGTADS